MRRYISSDAAILIRRIDGIPHVPAGPEPVTCRNPPFSPDDPCLPACARRGKGRDCAVTLAAGAGGQRRWLTGLAVACDSQRAKPGAGFGALSRWARRVPRIRCRTWRIRARRSVLVAEDTVPGAVAHSASASSRRARDAPRRKSAQPGAQPTAQSGARTAGTEPSLRGRRARFDALSRHQEAASRRSSGSGL